MLRNLGLFFLTTNTLEAGKDYKRTAKFVKGMRKKGESIETDTSSLLILIFRFTVMVSEWRVYWR